MLDNFIKDSSSKVHLPPNFNIQIEKQTVECKPDLTLRKYINFFNNRQQLLGIMGPPCSEAVEVVSIISKHYKMSTISYSAEGISFANRTNFPYFFRTIGENTQ
jgi:ABC-type branched-subunit amino acid transport system substrate-binding protein